MKIFFTILVLTLFASSTLAQNINLNQGQGSIKQKRYLQKIPYQIKGEHLIVVPVIINGKTYNFLFDTGASLTISDKLFKELNLPIIGQEEIIDAEGAKKEMKFILLPMLQLQEITFVHTVGTVHHEESSDFVNLFECYGIDGTIGSDMFRNSVVQFDEQSKHIIITDDFKRIAVKKTKYHGLQMEFHGQSSPFIWVGIIKGEQKTSDMKVLFDTGEPSLYVMSINAYDWFSERGDIADKIAESEGSYAWGVHGNFEKQKHLLLNIPELRVSGKSFKDVVISTTNLPFSRIGFRLLQHGKVTLDYKKKRFIYEPFDGVDPDKLSARPLAIFPTWQNNKLVVGIIWDKALEGKINLGDEILNIDGLNIENMALCDYMNLEGFFHETFTNQRILELRDIKTGEVKKIEIKRL